MDDIHRPSQEPNGPIFDKAHLGGPGLRQVNADTENHDPIEIELHLKHVNDTTTDEQGLFMSER